MSVTGTTNRNDYTGDGTTLAFAYTFKVFAATDLQVFIGGVLKTLTTDYAVSGVGLAVGGNVTFSVAPSVAMKVAIVRSVPYTQTTTWVDNNPFPASNLNDAADKQTILTQQLLDISSRTPQLVTSSTFKNLTVSDPIASQFLRWKADLSGLENVAIAAVGSLSLPVSIANGGTGAADAPTARTNLGVPLPIAVASGGTSAIDAPTARTNLGVPPSTRLVTAGVGLTGGGDLSLDRTLALTTPVAIANGGTAGTTAAGARTNLGLNFVRIADNFAGADLGAQINAAFTDLGASVPGEVWVFGTSAIASPITIGVNQGLRFFPGTRALNTSITLSSGSYLMGESIESTIFTVATFLASSVILANGPEPAGTIQDLQVQYTQLDTNVRASLTTYPATITNTAPRLHVRRVKIVRAWNGITMTGNTGGAYLQDLEISAFNIGVSIDGALDTVRISQCHFWPFGLTANQTTIYNTALTIGISSGRCDFLHLQGCLFLCGTQLQLTSTVNGTTFGNATGCGFDTRLGLSMTAGKFTISNSYFSSDGTFGWVNATGGHLIFSNVAFGGSVGTLAGLTWDPGIGNADASMVVTGCDFDTGAADRRSILLNSGDATITGCKFLRTINGTYTAPTIDAPAAGGPRVTIIGNRPRDKGTGTGTFINIASDNQHRVVYNIPIGWTMTFPVAASGIYSPN